jgi:hypothetical protein
MRGTQPVAVLIPYENYLELQSLLELPKAKEKALAAGLVIR